MTFSDHLRAAVRLTLRHSGFATAAIVSLGLAIALNATMYSLVDAMINPNSHIPNASRLYSVTTWGDIKHKVDDAKRAELIRSVSDIADAISTFSSNGSDAGDIEFEDVVAQVATATVAPNFFRVLGLRPVRGRLFDTSDVYASSPPVLISARLAERLSPSKPFVVGQSVVLNGTAHPVIGILDAAYGRGWDLWLLPSAAQPLSSLVGNVVLLKRGVTLDDANRRFALVATRLAGLSGEAPSLVRYELRAFTSSRFRLRGFHYALVGAVVAVLLVACANLANLQLARGLARTRELATRLALGASRRQIIAQLFAETAVLAVMGAAAGLLLTFWAVHLLEARVPATIAEYMVEPQISWRLGILVIVACFVCSVIVGLYPALTVSRVDPNELLKSGAGTGATRRNRQRYGIVVGLEIALALAVLSGATVVSRAARAVRGVQVGFDPRPLSAAWIMFRSEHDTTVDVTAVADQLIDRVRYLPLVANAAAYYGQKIQSGAITTDSRHGPPQEFLAPNFLYQVVTPAYFRTLNLRITKGRDFLDGQSENSDVIVDQQTAQRLWPGVDPIGRQIKLGEYRSEAPWLTVVGVVQNIDDRRYEAGLPGPPPRAERRFGDIFVRAGRNNFRTLPAGRGFALNVVVRGRKDFDRIPVALNQFLPKAGLIERTMTSTMEKSLSLVQERERHDFVAELFSLFACLAVGLAAIGVYAIITHSTAERNREIGVRLALGATRMNVVRLLIRDNRAVFLGGIAVGLIFIVKSTDWLTAFSLESDRHNSLLYSGTVAIMLGISLVAAAVPALRGSRQNPVEALRSD